MTQLKRLFKFGVPLSFVYCTIYQQNVWREADETLLLEQRRVWSDFFKTVDNVYNKLNLSSPLGNTDGISIPKSIVPQFSVQCWNSKVQTGFKAVDEMVSNPKMIACYTGRAVKALTSFSIMDHKKGEPAKTEAK